MVATLGINSSPVIALYIVNLDSESTEIIYKLMRDINRKFSTTFVVITYDKKIAEKADRIVEIKDHIQIEV
ncbi:hypothetical protein ACIQZI_15445 [Peribacillus sp. NPDC096379]|uniref:hypothetical protein n=1 Tax=Peribacillus sp. NPDC096379 TaxID=3364393 RepID=UPI00382D5402